MGKVRPIIQTLGFDNKSNHGYDALPLACVCAKGVRGAGVVGVRGWGEGADGEWTLCAAIHSPKRVQIILGYTGEGQYRIRICLPIFMRCFNKRDKC